MHILGSRVGALRVVVAVSGLGLGLGISILVVRSLWICPFMNSFFVAVVCFVLFFFKDIVDIYRSQNLRKISNCHKKLRTQTD